MFLISLHLEVNKAYVWWCFVMVDLGIAKLLSCNYSIKLSSAASNYAGAAKTETEHTAQNLIDLTQ